MATFDVKRIPEFETIQHVSKLFRDGKCLLDEFITNIESDKNFAPELGDLFAIIEDIADCKIHPKYKKLHLSDKLKFTGYEAKSKHLRLYLFHEKGTGQILAFGGKKGDQDEDIKRFEKLIKEYTLYKNQEK